MNKKSQKQRVLGQLKQYGQISRNACLKNYISRLSAIIYDLKKEGYEFTEKEINGDYVYFLVDRSRDRVEYDNYNYQLNNDNIKYV